MLSNGAASSQSVGHHTAMDRWRKLVFDFDAMGEERYQHPMSRLRYQSQLTCDTGRCGDVTTEFWDD